jgi:pilus assembly protein CpaE
MFAPGLRQSDIEKAIGGPLVSCIPNDYALVREAIDRGVTLEEVKQGNKITMQLKKLIFPEEIRERSGIPFLGRKTAERKVPAVLTPQKVT